MAQVLLFLFLVLLPSSVFGSGFGIFTQGAKGLAQANAVVAHAAGPSSLYFNPALLTEVEGRQVEAGVTAINPQREFRSSASGNRIESEDWYLPGSLYLTQQHGRVTAGLGLFSPFGLATEWPSDYEGRYIAFRGEISTLDINPVVAVRINENLSLAAGFNLLYLDTQLDSAVNQVAAGFAVPPAAGGPVFDPTLPDIHQKFSGNGWGRGYNLGLVTRLGERLTFGAAYRSALDVKVDGSASFEQVDPRLAVLFPATNGSTEFHLPQQASFGLAARLSPELTIEIGARWEDWSNNDNQLIHLDRQVLGQDLQVIPRNWSATWAYNLGAEYHLDTSTTLLAGYLFGDGAVPAETFEPLIPDADVQLFTLGLEKKIANWAFGAAIGYQVHEEATKLNQVGDPLSGDPTLTANGSYRAEIFLFAFSVGYRF